MYHILYNCDNEYQGEMNRLLMLKCEGHSEKHKGDNTFFKSEAAQMNVKLSVR